RRRAGGARGVPGRGGGPPRRGEGWVVRGRAPADALVVVGHLFQAIGRDPASARDVLQEGTDLLRTRGSAEGDQQDGVGGRHQRADSSWTASTSARAWSTGVDGSTP